MPRRSSRQPRAVVSVLTVLRGGPAGAGAVLSLIAVASPAGKQVIVGWRADCDCNSHGSVDPLTVITVIAPGDHDIDRPLAPGAVVPGHLLRAANVFDVQPERVAGLHLPEQIFLVGLSLGDHRSPCWFWASLKGLILLQFERFRRRGDVAVGNLPHIW